MRKYDVSNWLKLRCVKTTFMLFYVEVDFSEDSFCGLTLNGILPEVKCMCRLIFGTSRNYCEINLSLRHYREYASKLTKTNFINKTLFSYF